MLDIFQLIIVDLVGDQRYSPRLIVKVDPKAYHWLLQPKFHVHAHVICTVFQITLTSMSTYMNGGINSFSITTVLNKIDELRRNQII